MYDSPENPAKRKPMKHSDLKICLLAALVALPAETRSGQGPLAAVTEHTGIFNGTNEPLSGFSFINGKKPWIDARINIRRMADNNKFLTSCID